MNKSAIPYYRVSTDRQGQSGLGLEAQKKAVQEFAASKCLQLIGEYVEVESGKKKQRPVLKQALKNCKKEQAVLLIAKLDRLSRNVRFISTLLESQVEFIAVDNPHANKLLLHITAAFAEYECEANSARTKEALKVVKERGVQLGKYGKDVLAQQNKQSADKFALKMEPVLEQLKERGYKTIRSITKELNKQQIKTFSGGEARWHVYTVCTVMKRIEKLRTTTSLNL